jgi:chorismate mutase/prephenate dehydratase
MIRAVLGATMKELNGLRQKIDAIDERLLKLLNQRAKIVQRIGRLKAGKQVQFHAPQREREIYERLERLNQKLGGLFPQEAVQLVFREIVSASRSLEAPLQVAYLGPPATFTQMAALQHFGMSVGYSPVGSIKEVFNEVERGRAEYGVVPIENSTEGVVNHTIDMFIDSPLKIAGEVLQEVSHQLLSLSGKMESIKRLYSHPHAIAQCKGWIESNLPGVPVREVYSTAKAAELCKDDPSAAAIASELAARLYGLQVVKKRIEDNPNNYTRFLIIGQRSPARTGQDKTSIMFSIKDRVGALYEMLRSFADLGINLTKIESRPSKKKAWEYIFFVDLEGHTDDRPVARAIEALNAQCLFLKILGSYPSAKR